MGKEGFLETNVIPKNPTHPGYLYLAPPPLLRDFRAMAEDILHAIKTPTPLTLSRGGYNGLRPQAVHRPSTPYPTFQSALHHPSLHRQEAFYVPSTDETKENGDSQVNIERLIEKEA